MTETTTSLLGTVEGHDGILVIRSSGNVRQAGDLIFIEPGVPHEVFNLSSTEPVVAVVARSDPSEGEHIIPYDRANGV